MIISTLKKFYVDAIQHIAAGFHKLSVVTDTISVRLTKHGLAIATQELEKLYNRSK